MQLTGNARTPPGIPGKNSSPRERSAMAVRRLNHAVLYVNGLERTVDFYTKTLGFEVRLEIPGRAAFLRAPDSANDHDLGLFEIGTASARPPTALPPAGLPPTAQPTPGCTTWPGRSARWPTWPRRGPGSPRPGRWWGSAATAGP